MNKVILVFVCMLLGGCASMSGVTQVKVAIPVKCKAEVPTKPAWPLDAVDPALPDDQFAFAFMRGAAAEIELREGYEGRLLAALQSCL